MGPGLEWGRTARPQREGLEGSLRPGGKEHSYAASGLTEADVTQERRPRLRVAVAIRRERQVLLVEHTKDGRSYWLLPGGGLDWGETLHTAGAREVVEETALGVKVGKLLFCCETISPDGGRHIVHLMFEGEADGAEVSLPDEERITGSDWFTADEVRGLTMHPPIQAAVADWLEREQDRRQIDPYLGNLWVD